MMNREEELLKIKNQQILNIFWLVLVLLALIVISIVSFSQTENAYKDFNDPNLIILGFQIGIYLSVAYAVATQYGQNVILFLQKNKFFGEEILLFEFEIGNKVLRVYPSTVAFLVLCLVDALTNIVWYYNTVNITNTILRIVLNIVGYFVMIASVFVEELVGMVWDGLREAIKQYKTIADIEKRGRKRENQDNGNRSTQISKPSVPQPKVEKPSYSNNKPNQYQQQRTPQPNKPQSNNNQPMFSRPSPSPSMQNQRPEPRMMGGQNLNFGRPEPTYNKPNNDEWEEDDYNNEN